MVFYNAFKNITSRNNKLKILSQWFNNGIQQEDIITVTIPVGHYTLDQLCSFLNGGGSLGQMTNQNAIQCPCMRNPASPNTVAPELHGIQSPSTSTLATGFAYGMGTFANTSATVVDPSVAFFKDDASLHYQPPTTYSINLPGYNATHAYSGFYLIVDSDTQPFLDTVGLLQTNGGVRTNVLSVQGTTAATNYQVISNTSYAAAREFDVVLNSSNVYSYKGNSLPNPPINYNDPNQPFSSTYNTCDLGSPSGMLISWENVSGTARNSCDQLTQGDTIAFVPILAGYKYKQSYEAKNPFRCVIPNMNVNTFHILIRNADTGEQMDFQNVDWLMCLEIEFSEIDTSYLSAAGKSGMYQTSNPLFHDAVLDHNLPLSGLKKRRQVEYSQYDDSKDPGFSV